MGGDGSGAADDDASALAAAARRLWPTPGDEVREYLLVPSARRPRLLLPVGEHRAAAAVARRASSLTSGRERAVRAVVALAARTGIADVVVRDRLRVAVTPGGDDIEGVLAEVLGERVLVSLAVGTARANRKPILQVLTPRGRTVAWVKVGDTAMAAGLVDGEAAALARLAEVRFDHLRVPEVLHHGTWRDLRLLVLSALGQGGGRRAVVPTAAMVELARAEATARGAVGDSPFWHRLEAVAGSHDRAAALVAAAAGRWGGTPIELGWSHGDWTPWNMAWVGDEVHVWDWERFETATPVGVDALHHHMQHRAQRTGDWPAAVAALDAEAPALLGAVGSQDDPATVVGLYLLDLACRYAEAGAGPLGVHLRDRADWLAGVVAERLR